MLKKILLIILLIFLIIISFNYYLLIDSVENYIKDESNIIPYPFLIKEIQLYNFDEFELNNYFYIISVSEYDCFYEFSDKLKLTIKSEGISYDFYYDYSIIEVEPEIIEVIKKIPVYIEKNNTINKSSVIIEATDQDYFAGYHDISITKDSSIDRLVYLLMNDIETSYQVNIDYSSVNLSCPGEYTVIYYFNNESVSIKCHVI